MGTSCYCLPLKTPHHLPNTSGAAYPAAPLSFGPPAPGCRGKPLFSAVPILAFPLAPLPPGNKPTARPANRRDVDRQHDDSQGDHPEADNRQKPYGSQQYEQSAYEQAQGPGFWQVNFPVTNLYFRQIILLCGIAAPVRQSFCITDTVKLLFVWY